METFISAPTALLVVGIISIMLLSFGFFISRRMSKNSNDFLYAGRNVGLALSTATLIAAWVTGNTTMSAPEQGYTLGIIACFGYATAGLALVIFAPLALRIKKIMPNGCTSGDFIRIRFGRRAWGMFLIVSAVYFLAFLITQAMAGGILLEALSGLQYRIGMVLIMVVCTIYTLKGGLKAILGTDFILSLLIMGVLFVTAVLAFFKFSPSEVYQGVMTNKPDLMNLITGTGLMYLGSNFLFASGEIFHSNIWWQRIYASNEKVAAKSFILSGLIWTTVPVVAGSLAFVAVANGYAVPQVNMVFPIVVSKLLGPVGAILVLIVIYSALASTISSVLTSSANLLVQDIYKSLLHPEASDEQVVKYVRYTIVGLAVLAVGMSWWQINSMYQVLLYSGPAVASTVWPIAYGVFNKKTNRKAAFWAMLCGLVVGFCGYTISSYAAPIFSCLTSMLIMVIATQVKPDNDFHWKELNDEMVKALAAQKK